MLDRQKIVNALIACAGDEPVLVIHSSLAHIRLPAGVGKWDFLYGLRVLLDRGFTVAIPAFTFSFCQGKPYRFDSPSEVGLLGDWARELNGFSRTHHPIYSYVVGGPLAATIKGATNTTTFGDDSTLAIFEDLGARIIMFGCKWDYCTQFHRYEEEVRVPYRVYKTFKGNADYGRGMKPVSSKMYVRDMDIDASNDFQPIVEDLHQRGEIKPVDFYSSKVESASVDDIARTSRAIFKQDSFRCVENSASQALLIQQRTTAKNQPALSIAILGDANLTLVSGAIEKTLKSALPDRTVKLYTPEFGQTSRAITDTGSELYAAKPEFVLFADRLEDLVGMPFLDTVKISTLENAVDRYIENIRTFRERSVATFFVSQFAVLNRPVFGAADIKMMGGVNAVCQSMNQKLDTALAEMQAAHTINLQSFTTQFGDGPVLDSRLWYLGRFPFSDSFSEYLGERISAYILSIMGRSSRLIVLDLDGTLWGGVLGEDSAAGLNLGGDYPGNAFQAFQKILKRLTERGIALAVCSKNDEDMALNAIDSLPSMVLKRSDLAAYRINWEPKWKNLASMCDELMLGLGNVLFIDDNPVEREQMRRQLPEVKVLDLPEDPTLYVDALLDCIWLEAVSLTEEDKKRVESFRSRSIIQNKRAQSEDLTDFYASLKSHVFLAPLNDDNLNRALQLIHKTNQFNTTTRRYSSMDLQSLQKDGAEIIVIGSEDSYSDFENIGVLILKWDRTKPMTAHVDSYLLSCRILGRGVETAVIKYLMALTHTRGAKYLVGEIVPTERNTPARSVFRDAGFLPAGPEGLWQAKLGDHCHAPDWLRFTNRLDDLT